MGWLDELKYDYLYECECGHDTVAETKDDSIQCECGRRAVFARMLPMQLGLSGKVAYDQNGRKAYMLQGKKGRRPTYISATKWHYLETGEIKPHYTKEFEQKTMKESPEYLVSDTVAGKGRATPHKAKETQK